MIRVVDGDTFVAVRGGSERVTVYLSGVDAPERGQAGSAEARRFLETLLLGKQVLVEESSSHRGRAGFVTLFNTALSALPLELKKTLGQVNLAVVAAGMGWWLHQESPPAPPERVQDDSWVRRLAVAERGDRRAPNAPGTLGRASASAALAVPSVQENTTVTGARRTTGCTGRECSRFRGALREGPARGKVCSSRPRGRRPLPSHKTDDCETGEGAAEQSEPRLRNGADTVGKVRNDENPRSRREVKQATLAGLHARRRDFTNSISSVF